MPNVVALEHPEQLEIDVSDEAAALRAVHQVVEWLGPEIVDPQGVEFEVGLDPAEAAWADRPTGGGGAAAVVIMNHFDPMTGRARVRVLPASFVTWWELAAQLAHEMDHVRWLREGRPLDDAGVLAAEFRADARALQAQLRMREVQPAKVGVIHHGAAPGGRRRGATPVSAG